MKRAALAPLVCMCMCIPFAACAPQLSGELELVVVGESDDVSVAKAALFAVDARDTEETCGAHGRRDPVAALEFLQLSNGPPREPLIELAENEGSRVTGVQLPLDAGLDVVVPLTWIDLDDDGAMNYDEPCAFFDGTREEQHIIAIESGVVRLFDPERVQQERALQPGENDRFRFIARH